MLKNPALALKRALEIGSYQTAWATLHRLRSVLARPGRERLHGEVEVDETYIGGEEPGLRGGRQKGKKVLIGVAVERENPRGFGRCRMAPIPDASAETLRSFLQDNVEPGATVITDSWPSYPPATSDLYVHQPLKGASGRNASQLLPGVHKVSSLAKRWLLGTHQGSIDEAHLSCSASTAAARAVVAWSSTACSSSPSSTTPCATASSSTTPSPAAGVPSRPGGAAVRPASSDPARAGHGRRPSITPPKWIPHKASYLNQRIVIRLGRERPVVKAFGAAIAPLDEADTLLKTSIERKQLADKRLGAKREREAASRKEAYEANWTLHRPSSGRPSSRCDYAEDKKSAGRRHGRARNRDPQLPSVPFAGRGATYGWLRESRCGPIVARTSGRRAPDSRDPRLRNLPRM